MAAPIYIPTNSVGGFPFLYKECSVHLKRALQWCVLVLSFFTLPGDGRFAVVNLSIVEMRRGLGGQAEGLSES